MDDRKYGQMAFQTQENREQTLFPRLWYGGMISAKLEVIWEMSGANVFGCWEESFGEISDLTIGDQENVYKTKTVGEQTIHISTARVFHLFHCAHENIL